MDTRYRLGGIPVGISQLGDEAAVLEGVGINKEKEDYCYLFLGYGDPDLRVKLLTKNELNSKENLVKYINNVFFQNNLK